VGLACQVGTVLVDDRLRPVLPALLWQDRRALAEADALDQELGELGMSISGRRPAPELGAPRVRWIARHEPDAWARTRWVLSLKDFLLARLTGAVVTDATSASYSLLFDVRRRAWSPELASAAAVPLERLPAVLPATEAGGRVTASAADTGLPAGLPVAVGGPDGSVAALGAGAVRAGVTVDVAGTTDVLVHVTAAPTLDPTRRSVLNAYLLPGLWTVGGPTGMTSGTIAWLAGILGFATVEAAYAALGAAAAGLPPGADGVTFHPTLSGGRFPTWTSEATGSIAGLRPGHGPAHLLRAAEEGAAFVAREGLAAIESLGIEIGEVRVAGGVARQAAAMQLRADAWGRTVMGIDVPEATTIGAAMLAAVSGGLHPGIEAASDQMVRVGAPVTPNAADAPAWGRAYRRWLAARLGE
jgi:sugar (pentulose or hexulose) kinase